jgi:hypothetical protein
METSKRFSVDHAVGGKRSFTGNNRDSVESVKRKKNSGLFHDTA